MGEKTWFRTLALVVGIVAAAASPVLSGDRTARSEVDVHDLYGRLSPGMSLREVAEVAGGQLATARESVTTWILWSPLPGGAGTAVLRAAFQAGRLTRVEYESFGAEYRRLVKSVAASVEIPGDELARIWRQTWRVEQAAESCQDALEAYHRVMLGAQERLTPEQQQAWARALLLRRAAEERLLSTAR